jgi:hypothetical protein
VLVALVVHRQDRKVASADAAARFGYAEIAGVILISMMNSTSLAAAKGRGVNACTSTAPRQVDG